MKKDKIGGILVLNKNDTKMLDEINKATYKCQCGHSVLFYYRETKKICSHCGYYCFKDDKERFRYRLKEKINKKKKEVM